MKPVLLRTFRKKRSEDAFSFPRLLSTLFVFLIAAGVFAIGFSYALLSRTFPSLEDFELYYSRKPIPTQFYDRTGTKLLLTLAYEGIEGADLKKCDADGEGCFPAFFLKVVSEDGKKMNAIAGKMAAKVYAESLKASPFSEYLLSLLVSQLRETYGDETLLTWYCNRSWYGQMSFGADAASRLYLNKPASEMNNAECVLLSAILVAPGLNPFDSNAAIRESYTKTLDHLLETGVISRTEADALSGTNVVLFEPPAYRDGSIDSIILKKAVNTLYNAFGQEEAQRGGYTVITTMDAELQEYLNAAAGFSETPVSLDMGDPEKDETPTAELLRKAPVSAAIMEPSGGQLLAALETESETGQQMEMFLSRETDAFQYLFTGLAAFTHGYSPSALFWDADRGPVWLREVLRENIKEPLETIRTEIGRAAGDEISALFGMIPGKGLTVEDIASALSVLANKGVAFDADENLLGDPVSIIRVLDPSGKEVEISSPRPRPILSEGVSYLMTNTLSGNTLSDRPSASGHETAGDGGTLYYGYTKDAVCTVRVGKENTLTAFEGDEGRAEEAAEALWRSLMGQALRFTTPTDWEIPEEISHVKVCVPSGKLPTGSCPETVTEVFLAGNEPRETDDFYVTIPVNQENQLPATAYTPLSLVENKVFMNMPEEGKAWADSAGIEPIPSEYDPIRTENSGSTEIVSPGSFSEFRADDPIEIIIKIEPGQFFETYQVSVGDGMFPQNRTEYCGGGPLEEGKWLLCTLGADTLGNGLKDLRVSMTDGNGQYFYNDRYITISPSAF